MAVKAGTLTNPKGAILDLIEKSTDEAVAGKSSFFVNLRVIEFDDVMDVVLYYISLQSDLKKIAKIDRYKFYEFLKKAWEEWSEKAIKSWGYKHYEYPLNSGRMNKTFRFYHIDSAWGSGPPDAGGATMGAAAHYAYLHPGFLQHDYLLLFFSYPRGLPYGAGNWPSYRDNHIKKLVFPKWRRKAHKNKLELTFQLAEMVCAKMREAGK